MHPRQAQQHQTGRQAFLPEMNLIRLTASALLVFKAALAHNHSRLIWITDE